MSKRTPPPIPKLKTLRPVLDRLVFIFALLGVLTTIHLFIQQNRGFDQGCFGFSTNAEVEAVFDCSVVTESNAAKIFGISNVYWGFSFYVFIVALSFSVWISSSRRRQLLKRIRALSIFFGFIYSAYLVYFQFFGIEELCALCLTSATIETFLLSLVMVDYFSRPKRTIVQKSNMKSRNLVREATVLASIIVLVIVIAGADFAYFNNLENTHYTGQDAAGDFPAVATSGTGSADSLEGCVYDPDRNPLESWQDMVTVLDLQRGNSNAAVTFFDFFDPNCTHCRTLHMILEEIIAEYEDKVNFVYKPFVLWQHSMAQSAALYAAAQEGKFVEMLNLQMAYQNPQTGLQEQQLRELATQIGIDAEVMLQRVESGIYLSRLQRINTTGRALGIISVPTVMINGRFVASSGKTKDCLTQLLEEAVSAQ